LKDIDDDDDEVYYCYNYYCIYFKVPSTPLDLNDSKIRLMEFISV